MTKEDFEKLKSTVKQWLFHTGSLDVQRDVVSVKLYAIRIDKGTNKERYVLIKAKNPTQAIGIAVMDRTPKE